MNVILILCFGLLFSQFKNIGVSGAANVTCYQQKSDFVTICNNLAGVVDGGRCFFFGTNIPGDWAACWAACRAKGGVLAQVHTLREYNLLIAYATQVGHSANTGYFGDNVWMAFRDEGKATGSCSATGTVAWYDDEVTPDPYLVTNNTLATYYQCNSTAIYNPPRCFSLRWAGGQCNFQAYPICQITNSIQNFTFTNSCMTEPPTITVNGATVNDCATACASYIWCHSFNFLIGSPNNQCQLFPRSITDCTIDLNKCPSYVLQAGSCSHYNYV